jgi:hypothetical protein
MTRILPLLLILGGLAPLSAQTAATRLPLPVDGPAGALIFDAPGPPATVLTGLLWPSSGPLTAWAPVFSTYQIDGTLKETQTGGWIGPRPRRWIKVSKEGFVVGGFRVLIKTAPGTPQSRQAQIFWKPWQDGQPKGNVLESQVYGLAAEAADQVRIIELRLPEGAIPTGLYGETLSGAVVQASLIVRLPPPPPVSDPAPGALPSKIQSPSLPQEPVVGPVAPLQPSPF